jgi:hypothetical protein
LIYKILDAYALPFGFAYSIFPAVTIMAKTRIGGYAIM